MGHTDATELLRTIHQELQKVDDSVGISRALFVSLHGGKGFDAARAETDVATLYSVLSNDCQVQTVQTGILQQVNKMCAQLDEDLAKQGFVAVRSRASFAYLATLKSMRLRYKLQQRQRFQ